MHLFVLMKLWADWAAASRIRHIRVAFSTIVVIIECDAKQFMLRAQRDACREDIKPISVQRNYTIRAVKYCHGALLNYSLPSWASRAISTAATSHSIFVGCLIYYNEYASHFVYNNCWYCSSAVHDDGHVVQSSAMRARIIWNVHVHIYTI